MNEDEWDEIQRASRGPFWAWGYDRGPVAPTLWLGWAHLWWFADDPWHTLRLAWNLD